MADDSEDLVGKVDITGIPETEAKLASFADKGAASFDKVAAAAKKAGVDVKKSTDGIEKGAGDAADGLNKIGKADVGGKTIVPDLKGIEQASRQLGTGIRNGIKDLAQFATRIAAIGTAGAAAAIGLAVLARNAAQSINTTISSSEQNSKAQIQAAQDQNAAANSAIQYNSQLRQLNAQLVNGSITYEQYNASLRSTRASYAEQKRVTAELAFEQETLRLETERLQKTAADTKAYNALIDKFGGPLTSSIIAFGTQVEGIRQQLVQAFSPAISSAIDAIVSTINANSSGISGFIGDAAGKVQQFVSQNAPAIRKAIESIGAGVKVFFDGVIAVAPQLLAFFNGTIVPAIQSVYGAIQQVAAGINSVFGTQVTAGFLVVIAAVIKFTGSLKLAIDAIQIGVGAIRLIGLTMSPWLVILGLVAAALYLLYTNVDWSALAAKIIAFGQSVINFFVGLPATIGASIDALWAHITETATQLVTDVTTIWQTLLDWFAAFPDQVIAFFTTLGQGILDTFNNAITAVKNYFSDLYNSAVQYLTPIIDLLKTINSLLSGASGAGGGDAPAFAGGGHVGSGPVRGPGTSTSDSIAAWLSNNEYVMQARAVVKYGRSFMDAVNTGRLSLKSIRGYRVGGLVSSPPAMSIPRFASGGPVESNSNMRPFNLNIAGELFDGLMAPEAVADRLSRFAVKKQSKSSGRKPNWFGGKS